MRPAAAAAPVEEASVMSEPVETFEVNGKTVKIYHDEDAESPRNDDDLGVMLCWHRRILLGDEQIRPSDFGEDLGEVREKLGEERGAALILPVYIYEHGQITITARESVYAMYPDKEWDAGQVGFIYAEEAAILKEYSIESITEEMLEKVREVLEGEVAVYDQYLMGDVWGFVIEDEEGVESDEHGDSCWGFFGLEYCRQEARAAAGGETE